MKWINDPGHGWLEVKTKNVLKILGDDVRNISRYSYLSPDGSYSYLEEDCDAGVFINAYGRDEYTALNVPEQYVEYTPIREKYPSFDPDWVFQYGHLLQNQYQGTIYNLIVSWYTYSIVMEVKR